MISGSTVSKENSATVAFSAGTEYKFIRSLHGSFTMPIRLVASTLFVDSYCPTSPRVCVRVCACARARGYECERACVSVRVRAAGEMVAQRDRT